MGGALGIRNGFLPSRRDLWRNTTELNCRADQRKKSLGDNPHPQMVGVQEPYEAGIRGGGDGKFALWDNAKVIDSIRPLRTKHNEIKNNVRMSERQRKKKPHAG